jgi:hypothetical protein
MPPVVGEFNGNRGEFYDQEQYKGRAIFCALRLVKHLAEICADGTILLGRRRKNVGTNWICELSR